MRGREVGEVIGGEVGKLMAREVKEKGGLVCKRK